MKTIELTNAEAAFIKKILGKCYSPPYAKEEHHSKTLEKLGKDIMEVCSIMDSYNLYKKISDL